MIQNSSTDKSNNNEIMDEYKGKLAHDKAPQLYDNAIILNKANHKLSDDIAPTNM